MDTPFFDKAALDSLIVRYPDSKVLQQLIKAGNISLEEWEDRLRRLGASVAAAEHLEEMIYQTEDSTERSFLIEICRYLLNNFSNLCWYYRTYKSKGKLFLNIYGEE